MARSLKPGDTLVVATHNPASSREIEELLAPLGLERGLGRRPRPARAGGDRRDLRGERRASRRVAAASGLRLPALADDSGPRASMRWAARRASTRRAGPAPAKDFGAAMRTVEDELAGAGAITPRSAARRFVAVALPRLARRRERDSSSGEVDGTLVWPPRGDSGFGYDPMFLPDGDDRTFGEMTRRGEARPPSRTGASRRRAPSRASPRRAGCQHERRASRGFGVYVHWPFCAAKCPYCDFNSHVRHQPPDQERFAAAFAARDRRHRRRASPGRTVSTHLPRRRHALADGAGDGRRHPRRDRRRTGRSAPDAEITLEANPSSVEAERFRGYRAAGVNRVSLGVQALNDADLKFLGRLHNVAEALRRDRDRARDLPAPLLRPDLRPPRPDARGLGGASSTQALGLRRRPPLALPAHHRARHAVRRALSRPASSRCPTRITPPTSMSVTQEVCDAAGLPAYEISNHAGRAPSAGTTSSTGATANMPASAPAPMAASGSPTGAMPPRPSAARDLAREGRIRGATASTVDDVLTREEEGDEMLLMGLRLAEGIDVERYRAISGRALDPARLTDLVAHGMVEHDPRRPRACNARGLLRARRGGGGSGGVTGDASGDRSGPGRPA